MRHALALVMGIILGSLGVAAPAHACSLATDYDYGDHGLIHVKDVVANETLASLRVENRMLGAGCELSNPRDIDGDLVAWSEPSRDHDDDRLTIYVHDLAKNHTRQVHTVAARYTESLSVHGDQVVHLSKVKVGRYEDNSRRYEPLMFIVDTASGSAVQRDLDPSRRVDIGGPWVAWGKFDEERGPLLWLYNAVEDTWALEGGSLADLGLPQGMGLRLVGDEWLLFQSANETWAYEIATERAYDVGVSPKEFWSGALSDGHLWTWGHRTPFTRIVLPDGEPMTFDTKGPSDMGAFGGDIVLVGQYSTPPSDSRWLPTTGPGLLIVAMLIAGRCRRKA